MLISLVLYIPQVLALVRDRTMQCNAIKIPLLQTRNALLFNERCPTFFLLLEIFNASSYLHACIVRLSHHLPPFVCVHFHLSIDLSMNIICLSSPRRDFLSFLSFFHLSLAAFVCFVFMHPPFSLFCGESWLATTFPAPFSTAPSLVQVPYNE